MNEPDLKQLHPNPPVVFVRDYAVTGVLTVNLGKLSHSAMPPPWKWTGNDVELALRAGVACLQPSVIIEEEPS